MTLRDVTEILFALGLGGIVVEAFRSWRQRKKMGADYADVIASSAIKLLEPLEHRIKSLEEELSNTKRRLTATEARLRSVQQDNQTLAKKLLAYENGGE